MLNFKKIISILLVALALIPTGSFAYNENAKGSKIEVGTRVSDYTKTVTITKTYNTPSDIPSSVDYTEYDTSIGMVMGGTLRYKSHYISGGGKCIATFTGTLYAGLRKAEK